MECAGLITKSCQSAGRTSGKKLKISLSCQFGVWQDILPLKIISVINPEVEGQHLYSIFIEISISPLCTPNMQDCQLTLRDHIQLAPHSGGPPGGRGSPEWGHNVVRVVATACQESQLHDRHHPHLLHPAIVTILQPAPDMEDMDVQGEHHEVAESIRS